MWYIWRPQVWWWGWSWRGRSCRNTRILSLLHFTQHQHYAILSIKGDLQSHRLSFEGGGVYAYYSWYREFGGSTTLHWTIIHLKTSFSGLYQQVSVRKLPNITGEANTPCFNLRIYILNQLSDLWCKFKMEISRLNPDTLCRFITLMCR